MKAAILAIGSEILSGNTLDTNSNWLSKRMHLLGLSLQQIRSIPDERAVITYHLSDLSQSVDLVVCTGGLGPTSDDITKKTIADFFGLELVKNQEVYDHLVALYARMNRKLPATVDQQALQPHPATILLNDVGTASGMLLKKEGFMALSLPGVPYEMKHLWADKFEPYLKSTFSPKEHIAYRNVLTAGIGESKMMVRLQDFEENLPDFVDLAYLPNKAKVKLRLTGRHPDQNFLTTHLDRLSKELKTIFSDHFYGEGDTTLSNATGAILKGKGLTLGFAESCTGGFLSHLITSEPGSSAFFQGAIVSYSNDIKTSALGVRAQTLEDYGAVSEETAREMAEGARRALSTDVALSITGIAGPGGGSEQKPVGTIHLAVCNGEKTIHRKLNYSKKRLMNIQYAANIALFMILKFVEREY